MKNSNKISHSLSTIRIFQPFPIFTCFVFTKKKENNTHGISELETNTEQKNSLQ